MKEQNFIEDNIQILSKQTMDLLLKQDNPADLIGLYMFYYYTAKWQKTNQAKATTKYTAQGLQWGVGKLRAKKQKLIELGLIEEITRKGKDGKIKGWYIKINFLWKQTTIKKSLANIKEVDHTHENCTGGESLLVDKSTPNALSVNKRNALSASKGNASIAETSSAERNHIFKENSKKEDKSNLKASKKKETFNCKTEIGKMMNDKQKHIEIIGCFFNAKKYTFPDKISLQAQLKRNLRPARELARYDNSKFSKAYGCVKKKFPEEWNLNTMLKYIPGI